MLESPYMVELTETLHYVIAWTDQIAEDGRWWAAYRLHNSAYGDNNCFLTEDGEETFNYREAMADFDGHVNAVGELFIDSCSVPIEDTQIFKDLLDHLTEKMQ